MGLASTSANVSFPLKLSGSKSAKYSASVTCSNEMIRCGHSPMTQMISASASIAFLLKLSGSRSAR